MATPLEDLRTKYPQYNDMSDVELADAFHSKYYADIPKKEYYTQIGLKPKTSQNGKDEDVNWLENIYRATGVHGANKGFANIFGFGPHVQEANTAAKQAAETHPFATGAGEIGADIAASVPFFMAGGAAARGIPLLNQSATAARIAGAGLGGLALGGVESKPKDESRFEHAGKSGLLAAGIDAVLPYAGRGIKKGFDMVKSPFVSHIASKVGNALPDSILSKNLNAARGTETPIGDVLGSGTLKKAFENKWAPRAGEAADTIMARTGRQIQQQGEQLIKKLGAGNPDVDANQKLFGLLKSAFKKQRTIKNNLYTKLDDIADEKRFRLALPRFQKLANDTTDTILNSAFVKSDPQMEKLFKKLMVMTGETRPPKIRDVNFLATRLREAGNSYQNSATSSDRFYSGLFKKLAGRLRQDLKAGINNSGSAELKAAYQTATDNYKKNYSGFLDKDFYKYLGGNADPENLIAEIIRPGKGDKANRILKIQNLLPKENRGLLGGAYLERAIDNIHGLNPSNMATLIKDLRKRQLGALFPDKSALQDVLKYRRLVGMNTEALSRLANPKTGQRGKDDILTLGNVLKTLAGSAAGAKVGGVIGSPIGALAALYLGKKIPETISRKLSEAATSEAARKKIISQIMNKRNRTATDNFIIKILVQRGFAPESDGNEPVALNTQDEE